MSRRNSSPRPPLCLMQSLERRTLFDATVCDSPVQDPAVAKADVALVNNQPPVVTVNNPSVTANEGSYATNSGSFYDPDFDFVTLSASVGSVFGSGSSGSWSWSYMAPDGPASQTITITATDSRGASSQTTFSLTVNNVAPTLTLSGPSEVISGEAFTITGSSSDPGQDTISSWTVNWGDGTETFPGGSSLTATHIYDTDGTFNITATATDEDGTFTSPILAVASRKRYLKLNPNEISVTRPAGGEPASTEWVTVTAELSDGRKVQVPPYRVRIMDGNGDEVASSGIGVDMVGDRFRINVSSSAPTGAFTVVVEKAPGARGAVTSARADLTIN